MKKEFFLSVGMTIFNFFPATALHAQGFLDKLTPEDKSKLLEAGSRFGIFIALIVVLLIFNTRGNREFNKRKSLLAKLKKQNIPYQENQIIFITKQGGKLFYLEYGNAERGWIKIKRDFGKKFAELGVSIFKLSEFLLAAYQKGKKTGMDQGHAILEYEGKKIAFALNSHGSLDLAYPVA